MADKTVNIGIKGDSSEFRREAEQLARDMIRSSRQYSTSSKEVLKDIEDQIRAIEKRNKLDAEFKRIRLESLRERGDVSGAQYTQASRGLINEYRQDELQTRLLREIIDTIVRTSKEEIREDRSTVEKTVRESKTVGQYGITGDEKQALKETIQRGIIGDQTIVEEIEKRKFNLAKYANTAMSVGGSLAGGDLSGLAMMGSRGLLSSVGSVGLVAGGVGSAILATVAGTIAGNASLFSKGREFALSTQTVASDLYEARRGFGAHDLYQRMGMNTQEGMDFYAKVMRTSGGRGISLAENLGLAGITKSRDISEDLLMQTIGYQRYSNTGTNVSVVSSFERVLKDVFGGDFKKKLVQLPEMMNVYNSLAQQMIQTTGRIDTQALTGFVGGIREGFGVEGINLQRYASGMLGGFRGSQNNYLRKMQFAALNRVHPGLGYQQAIEILSDPTSDPAYMQTFTGLMKRQGLRMFSSWANTMGFGPEEARKMFESNDFNKMFEKWGKINQDKTSPATEFNKYLQEAQTFTSTTKEISGHLAEIYNKLTAYLGSTLINDVSKGVSAGISSVPGSGTKYLFEKP